MDTMVLMEQISTLPDNLKEEVADFVGFLKYKQIHNKKDSTNNFKLSDIKGLGADMWKKIDIDKFNEEEREW